MNKIAAQAVYRIRRFRREGEKPKRYKYTFELIDEETDQAMAVCDLAGRAVFSTLTLRDEEEQPWEMRPNRKVMPSRWIVTDPRKQTVMQFDQKILGKITNPLYKTVLALLDESGNEAYSLVDPRTNSPDRILGLGPDDWAIMDGDEPVAKLVYLPKQDESPKSLLGRLKEWLEASDRGIVSMGSKHLLPAPVALGMLILFNELTDTSGG